MKTEDLKQLNELLWQYSFDHDSTEASGVNVARTTVIRRLKKQERLDAARQL